MASHHLNHHYQHQQNNYPSCHCCCCNPPPSQHHSPPLPHSNPYAADPFLVQSVVTQILQSSPNHLYPQFLQPPKQNQRQNQHYHHQQEEDKKQTRSLLKSLHRRIDALESSLHHLSSSQSLSHPSPSLSLRELAARTIQIHFRAFLVRRSRTLRQLKDLAFIKSCFNNLKSSLSSNPHLDHVALSQKAMDLLLKLDSVQGGDPMIRDGKRSISRELVRLLEFVDGISVKRQQISSRGMKNVRFNPENNKEFRDSANSGHRDLSGNHRVFLDKLNHKAKKIQGSYRVIEDDDEEQGELEDIHPINDQEENPRNLNYQKSELFQAQNGILVKRPDVSFRSKKSVRFADNGKVSRVFINTQDSDSDVVSIGGDIGVSGDDQRELVENLSREDEENEGFSFRVSEDEEEDEVELGCKGATQFNNDEGYPREYVKTEANHGLKRQSHNQNGNFVFTPPVPVTMEPRIDDLMSSKNNQRFVR